MAVETLEKEISGSLYSVTQMPARRALKMQAKLLKIFGPAATQMFVAASDNLDGADQSIPKAVAMLMGEIDDKTYDLLVMELLQGVRKNGVELTGSTVDFEFAGNLNSLYLVLQYVLEVNFGDFFQEGGIIKALFPGKESKIPPESKRELAKS